MKERDWNGAMERKNRQSMESGRWQFSLANLKKKKERLMMVTDWWLEESFHRLRRE